MRPITWIATLIVLIPLLTACEVAESDRGITPATQPAIAPAPAPPPSPAPAPRPEPQPQADEWAEQIRAIDEAFQSVPERQAAWASLANDWVQQINKPIQALAAWAQDPNKIMLTAQGDIDAQLEFAMPINELQNSCESLETQVGEPPTLALSGVYGLCYKACVRLIMASTSISMGVDALGMQDVERGLDIMDDGVDDLMLAIGHIFEVGIEFERLTQESRRERGYGE